LRQTIQIQWQSSRNMWVHLDRWSLGCTEDKSKTEVTETVCSRTTCKRTAWDF
jgi:hypothetical protein